MRGPVTLEHAGVRFSGGTMMRSGRTVLMALALTGTLAVTAHTESVTMTVTTTDKPVHEQVTLLGTDLYLKTDAAALDPDTSMWIHLDLARLKTLATLGLGDPWDPTNLSVYGQDLVTVTQSSPGQLQGTVDITKVPLPSMASAVAGFGDAVKAIPFQARTDDQGRITSLTIQLPALGTAVPASTTTMTFSDFGAPVHVDAPPASQTREAPDALYQIFGG
jgi:hypothetical protein